MDVPQLLMLVYDMMALPTASEVTTPLSLTVAIVVSLLLHTPPLPVVARVVTVPAQMVVVPRMMPASAVLFTVNATVLTAVPQPVVTL
jgi:hypothetical protein